MKKLVIISYEEYTGQQYAQTLKHLFGDAVDISFYSIHHSPSTHIEADIVLASTYSVYELAKYHVHSFDHIIIADITLRKDALEQLRSFPPQTKAILVNNSLESAIDTISLIYKHGIRNLDLIPAYPPLRSTYDCDLAITPGEVDLIPFGISQVIDLGDRVLSIKTISEIATQLNMTELLRQPLCRSYFDTLVAPDVSTPGMLGQIGALEQQIHFIMQVFGSGVISLDDRGMVRFSNTPAANLLGLAARQLQGMSLEQAVPSLWENGSPLLVRDQVINMGSQVLIASVHHLEYNAISQGYLVLIRRFTDLEKEQYKIRRQVMSRGHVAKYTFHDIVGKSAEMNQIKRMAQKFATSNSTVLIYGQTGTGKELFAQSIHNASPRRDFPFIAINCAAIPENLLESELFGYEEGSFTGAKKGGKAGYFELAHGGTLFLDEVSEMNINLQNRLLRVLQEKEVIRVGGNAIINVDVRIIAASNKNLKALVNQSKFRQDLYYRLNILNICLPPLENRKEDIPLLIEAMKQEMGGHFTLTEDAMKLIQSTHFEGNVRELRNLVERLLHADCTLIDVEVLQRHLDQDISFSAAEKNDPIIERFFRDQKQQLGFLVQILEALMPTHHTYIRMGRRSIQQTLEQKGVFRSEQEIRTALQVLQLYRLVQVLRGRGGTGITPLGVKVWEQLSAMPLQLTSN